MGDTFLQLQFKATCGIHAIAAVAVDTRLGRLLVCDGKTFGLWQLRDPATHTSHMSFLRTGRVPRGVVSILDVHVDPESSSYLATARLHSGENSVILIHDEGDGATELGVKAGAALPDKEQMDASVFNPLTHELILATCVRERRGKLRFFTLREVKYGEAKGVDRFMLLHHRDVPPRKGEWVPMSRMRVVDSTSGYGRVIKR
jgi:hypothetical protein